MWLIRLDKKQQLKKTKKTEPTDEVKMRRRFKGVFIVCMAALAIVAVRLLVIFVFDGNKYAQAALSQTESAATVITAKRGDILDSNNIQLVTSTLVYDLILDPKVILSDEDRYLEASTKAVEEFFNIPQAEVRTMVQENPKRSYIKIAEELTYAQVEPFINAKKENASIAGLWLEENYKRNYTFKTLASSVLGFMENGRGTYGLEYSYNDELTGTDGREYTFVNSDNVVETVRKEAENGHTVKLSIDYNIQTVVEEKIAEFMKNNPSENVGVILQDPNTGAIKAMADSNTFDCNNPRDMSLHYSGQEIAAMSDQDQVNALTKMWTNYCITQDYEPGSTFKPFTLAAGLEENKVKMDDKYFCAGNLQFLDAVVQCHITSGHGDLDTKGAIAESCNVALMEMSQKIGAQDFVKYQRKFGFGQYTGIDLPNERDCAQMLYGEDMSVLDLATNSFGQNFNLTMIQLSTAFCSVINGGYLYQPYVVKGVYSDSGELLKANNRTLVSRTISDDTSDLIKECLRQVVVDGTGTSADIDGYIISGKTGTAEKLGREEGVYLVSFIGFAPYENPEIVCYVVIDQPETGDQSGVSAGLFKAIMQEVLPYLNVTQAADDYDPAGLEHEAIKPGEAGENQEETSSESDEGEVSEEENWVEEGGEYEGDYEEQYEEPAYEEEYYNEEEYYEEPVYEETENGDGY